MKNLSLFLLLSGLLLLSAGCETVPDEKEKAPSDAMAEIVQDGETIPIYFPVYLLLKGDHLDRHGRIFDSPFVGIEISSVSDLDSLKAQYADLLAQQGWTMEANEDYQGAFRMIATCGVQSLEMRAVQGTSGPTYIFILYAASR